MDYLAIAGGFLLLVSGGEMLVRGAVTIARQLGVSPLLIGLTLVGFGTSTPELITSVNAALVGAPGIAVGNVIGSNIANALLILGVAAVIAPITCDPVALRRDGLVMLLAAVACLAVAVAGELGRPTGLLFVGALAAYVVLTYLHDRSRPDAAAAIHAGEADLVPAMRLGTGMALLLAVGGMIVTIVGAHFLVEGAIGIATRFGVSQTIVGLTVVAVGTSLPELVTSVMAAWRRQTDIAFGNIVGSNIYNVLGILGVTALIQPIAVPPQIIAFDIWVMLASTVLLLAFAWTGRRISRSEGAVFVLGYAAYIAALASRTA